LKEESSRPATLAAAAAAPRVVSPAPASSPEAKRSSSEAAQAARAKPEGVRFCVLAVELAGLVAVFRLFHLEDPQFQAMLLVAGAMFAVHYWLPFRWKEPFVAAGSLAAALYFLSPLNAALLWAAGLVLFLLLNLHVPFRWRLAAVATVIGLLIYGCSSLRVPMFRPFYSLFGSFFALRLIIYAYDVAHSRERPRLLPFLTYFYILPNYCALRFPVIDFQTMRKTYYGRDIHLIAQQGIQWMIRGAIQLMIYRLVVYFNDRYLPDLIHSGGSLVVAILLNMLLYLNISGHYHFMVGMLHLFGYDLPETNRRYLLARNFADFWRRINIYWKDFLVKIFYFPVYFKFRKQGEFRAQAAATAAVFTASWAMHIWALFWFTGTWEVNGPDALFWIIFGVLVLLNLVNEKRRKRPQPRPAWQMAGIHAAQVASTVACISTLKYLQFFPTFSSWSYAMTHWIGGSR
jgi:D-alanyl-lipoteichoic acid acyltransferase DltB (MBOAT superfamily)